MCSLRRRRHAGTGGVHARMGTAASIAAVALGACIIEKHFTLARADKGPDSEFSLEPHEFETLCTDANDAWLALGLGGYQRQKAEEESMVFRRSLYFVKNLPAGHVIEAQDIRSIRPGRGLPPKHLPKLIGRRLKVSASRGQPTSFDCFE